MPAHLTSRDLPDKVREPGRGARRRATITENLFFFASTLLAGLFAVVVLRMTLVGRVGHWGWDTLGVIAYLIFFWAILAYLTLPRIHRILTAIYVPDYFIGRTRTADGLLGDPINLALMGEADQIHQAMRTAGWTLADPVNLRSGLRIVTATLTRRSYPEAPVSPLLVFGKPQEFAYQQEVEGNPKQRHHVRFWPCPDGWLLPGGRRVEWLGAGTYDTAVGLSWFTLQVTHRIDANTDVERDYVVCGLQEAVPQAQLELLKDFSSGYHARNGGGDSIRTDGTLPIIDLRQVVPAPSTELVLAPTPLDEVGRRPISVIAAAALMLASILTAWLALVSLGIFQTPTDLPDVDRQLWLQLVIGSQVLAGLVSIVFAWLIYLGRNWARILAMIVYCLSLVGELGRFLTTEIPGLVILLNMTIEVLTLFALTSASAREWTRSRRTQG